MNNIIIFAGAGISAESGLKTFRDSDGIWKEYDLNEVCNFNTFINSKNDPLKREKIFSFYNKVKETILSVEPNNSHYEIANWQKKFGKDKVKIITANVDNLFEKAGCEDVLHVHGEIFNMHCAACSHIWHIGNEQYSYENRCEKCNSRLTKPNIVFFYENAPKYKEMYSLYNPKRRNPEDILLYIGSSMTVLPPNLLFGTGPKSKLGTKVLINKDTNFLDYLFDHKYYGLASELINKVSTDILKI